MTDAMNPTFVPGDLGELEHSFTSIPMDLTFASGDLECSDMSNAMDPGLAGTGFQDCDLFTIPDTMDFALEPRQAPSLQNATMSNAMDFPSGASLKDTYFSGFKLGMPWNAMLPTLAWPGSQGFHNLMSNGMERGAVATVLQDHEPSTASSIRPGRSGDWASEEDWIRVRPMITRLYRNEKRPLKAVKLIIENEHGLKATVKMYKDRINKWGLDKNNKEHEMAAILRKKNERDGIGKQSVLKVRGRAINLEAIHHYFQRKGIALDRVSARHAGASTPPGISCTTPPFSPRFTPGVPHSPSTPHSLAVPEQLLFNIDRYMSVSINSSIWNFTDEGVCINSISGRSLDDLQPFSDYCHTSAEQFRKKSFIKGRRALSKACGLIPRIIKEENLQTLEYLLAVLLILTRRHLPEVVTQLAAYISRMARILLDAEHPWGQICRMLGSIEPDHVEEIMIQCWQCTNKIYEQSLGEFHPLSLFSEILLISYCRCGDLVLVEQRLRKIQLQCREQNGFSNGASLFILQELGRNLYIQARYAEAESTAYELINNARETASYNDEVLGLQITAQAQLKQGKFDLAERNVIEAVELIGRRCDGAYTWAMGRMINLQSILQDSGLEQGAAELELEIDRMMSLAKLDVDDE